MLYVPEEVIETPEEAVTDKDLVQRLESTLIHWTRQIKEVRTERGGWASGAQCVTRNAGAAP